jgi:hypothetical protein
MSLLVGVPVLVDRGLNVGVAELLLDEVDGLPRPEPERRGRLSEIVKPDRGRQPRVLVGRVVAAATDVQPVEQMAVWA